MVIGVHCLTSFVCTTSLEVARRPPPSGRMHSPSCESKPEDDPCDDIGDCEVASSIRVLRRAVAPG
eukprot:CAMPEP_0170309150 /NCGR_PEP_ID=MMETSP0116_2-20130129/55030_1 /TAXON_ID=400756 /ORGANISM="Durinskia baltica, Strain CSIRO CS-38" /LENGTH=65 /DNA_ID=CAMNT_0010561363 /DNA_START=65 /DNA_END=258 /DNA_ORIENTATION=-